MWGDNTTLKAGFTARDIARIKKKTKLGDKLRLKTLKACDLDSVTNSKAGTYRRGTVIGKYPHHAQVRYVSGIVESFTWVQVLMGD